MSQNQLRENLNHIIDKYGIKLMFISKELNWEYSNLCKFKNGKVNISEKRIAKLEGYLEKYKDFKQAN